MRSLLVDVLTRLNRWPRRLAALSCALLAAASALAAHRAEPEHKADAPDGTSVVVVAARDLRVGTALVRIDLTTMAWPRALVPAGTSGDPAGLVGRRLAGALRKREAVTSTRLVGADLSAGIPAGQVATAVPINSGLAAVVRAGDRVDILAGPPDLSAATGRGGDLAAGAVLLTQATSVLAVLPAGDGAAGVAQVLVATDRATAVRLVTVQASRALAVVLSPP